ncbi:hypothetical protein B0H11DRAFT_2268957 [Mycena galericulata]|nr:hypothetical protein B0H11DRAFT_2268957 [Mycena galericulata]
MPLPLVKMEAPNTGATDVYAALEQAQRALSTAHANLKVDTIPVTVAEKRSDVLRLEISALKETLGVAVKERDAAFTEVENKVRQVAVLKAEHERDRVALAATVTEEREGLKRERDALAKEREVQRTTFEAEKKALLDEREKIAQRLQEMSQLVRSNPLPLLPQVATPLAVDKSPTIETHPKIILTAHVRTAPESDAPNSGSTSLTALAAARPPSTSSKPLNPVHDRRIEPEFSSDEDSDFGVLAARKRPTTKSAVSTQQAAKPTKRKAGPKLSNPLDERDSEFGVYHDGIDESDSEGVFIALRPRKRPKNESSVSVSAPPSQTAQAKSKERKTAASKPSVRTSTGSRAAQPSNRPYGDSLYAIQFRPRFKEPPALNSEVTST